MIAQTFKHISSIVKGMLYGDPECVVSSVSTDSRFIGSPKGLVFFALKTDKNDGHNYIPELVKRGVNLFVVSTLPENIAGNFIVVDNTLLALQDLAQEHRKKIKGKVIAITGSNGKTVVKEWLFQLLNTNYKVYRSPRSYNSQLGVALSLLNADLESDYVLIEAGISQKGEMLRLEQIISPDVALLTNIGEPHQENFASLKEKAQEKLVLFNNAKLKVLPADCKPINAVLNSNYIGFYVWSKNDGHNVSAKYQKGSQSIIFIVGEQSYKLNLPFSDEASVENITSCFTMLCALGFDPKQYINAFENLESVAMRLELKQGKNNSILINDTYNSDLGSLSIALDFLKQQAGTKEKQSCVILSDIVQSGKSTEKLYSQVNKLLVDKQINQLIAVGDAIGKHRDIFSLKSSFYASTAKLVEAIDTIDFGNKAVLVKGARRFEFEKITELLSEKIHKTTLEINLNKLTQNITYFRGLLKPETKIMAMVKAFAYGSGSYEIARHLQFHGINYLAVAVADEGVELRNAGVTIPIVVMAPEMQSMDTLLKYKLEPEIYSLSILNAFVQTVKEHGEQNYPVHIKVDTGMHRMGFYPEDMEELVNSLQSQRELKAVSIFSHLAAADEPDYDAFTLEQIKRFEKVAAQVELQLGYTLLKHILNSAGTERFSQYQFNMVRLGIGMYGVGVLKTSGLTPIGTFKTNVALIKEVPQEDTVGYGRKGVLSRDSRIAILPVGYADGLSRKVGNGRGYAIINGEKAPYVGNVCMDLCMLDITDIDAKVGDEVILFGVEPHINELARWMETIPYEVITSISQRVKRVFVRE